MSRRFACPGAVPEVGLEPTRGRPQRFLRPPRLPFRHSGVTPCEYNRSFFWAAVRTPMRTESRRHRRKGFRETMVTGRWPVNHHTSA